MKFEINGHIFEKPLNIKFRENPSNGSRVDPRQQTDRNNETSNRLWQFCERVLEVFTLAEQRVFFTLGRDIARGI